MVLPFDSGDCPLTVIWAIHEDSPHPQGTAPASTPWRTIVAHWSKINYASEKQKKPGTHPTPDFMADVVDPRSSQKFPGNIIPNATVEGRLLGEYHLSLFSFEAWANRLCLEINFQEKPFKQDSKFTGDKLTFMIDGDAKEGDIPKYNQGQKAFLVGFASHTPPGGKGGEMIKPIFRDDFCLWGHIEEGGKRWKILPMYFIPHGGGIETLTATTKYKFNPPPKGPNFTARMASRPAPMLKQGNDFVFVDGDGPQAVHVQPIGDNDVQGEKNTAPGDLKFDSADEEPLEDTAPDAQDLQFLEQPLQEEDFGPEAAAADRKAAEHEKDW